MQSVVEDVGQRGRHQATDADLTEHVQSDPAGAVGGDLDPVAAVIGGRGGNVIRSLGPPPETPDEDLPPEVLELRKLRRALSAGERRSIPPLKGQQLLGGGEVGK